MSWKWPGDYSPNELTNRVPECPVSTQIWQEYWYELQTWLDNGWLLPYSEEKLGPTKGLTPLIAVFRQNKSKVCPVLDLCELNGHVDAYTAHANICAQELREWQKKGSNVSVLDLWRAYLQLCVHESLWPYQIVIFEGKRYCLMHMGFGLNVAPSIIQGIVDAALLKGDTIQQATSTYIDNVFINKNIASAASVRQHLVNFGLVSKVQEWLQGDPWVLGLKILGECNMLKWKRGNKVSSMLCILTQCGVFSLCEKLVG